LVTALGGVRNEGRLGSILDKSAVHDRLFFLPLWNGGSRQGGDRQNVGRRQEGKKEGEKTTKPTKKTTHKNEKKKQKTREKKFSNVQIILSEPPP